MNLYHEKEEKLLKHLFKKLRVVTAAGGMVLNDKDEILFIYRKKRWDLPKGKTEKNETIESSAIREVEEETGVERMIESLRRSKKAGKTSSIIVVAEGEKSGKNIFELARFIEENLDEYEIRVSVLGHIQRGGSPSCFDRVLASKLGVGAVEALMEGKTEVMIGIHHQKVVHVNLQTAIKGDAKIDKELRRVADITSV